MASHARPSVSPAISLLIFLSIWGLYECLLCRHRRRQKPFVLLRLPLILYRTCASTTERCPRLELKSSDLLSSSFPSVLPLRAGRYYSQPLSGFYWSQGRSILAALACDGPLLPIPLASGSLSLAVCSALPPDLSLSTNRFLIMIRPIIGVSACVSPLQLLPHVLLAHGAFSSRKALLRLTSPP